MLQAIETSYNGFTFREITKACALALHGERPVLIFAGQIEPGMRASFAAPDGRLYKYAYCWGQCERCARIDIVDSEAWRQVHCPNCASVQRYRPSTPALRAAYEGARGARFEHGQLGASKAVA